LGLAAAIQFLTVVPLRRETSAGDIGRSLPFFPVVGLALGGLLLGLDRLFGLAFPAALVNILLIIALIVVTRALHVDGFIDTCDGLAGGSSADSRLEIMRDSRVGSFGVIGAVCLVLLLYVSLTLLPEQHRQAALVLAPAISRWTMVYAIAAYPYARKGQGLGATFKDGATRPRVAIATAVTLAACGGLLRLDGLAVMAASWLVAAAAAWYLSKKLGGLTGDTYGAINEVVQVAVLILIPLITWSYVL
jgi:adenosylcobinamide-GDP ribazoletransferase